MKIISFGKISIRYIFLLLIPIFWTGTTFTVYPLYKNGFNFHPLFFCLTISTGELIIGTIFELISLSMTKRTTKNETFAESLNIVTVTTFENPIKNNKEIKLFDYFLIGLLGTIDFIGNVFLNICSMQSHSSVLGYQLKPCQTIFTALFSIFILGLPLYFHHVFSIIALIIGIIFIIVDVGKVLGFDIIVITIFVLTYISFSVKDVGEKWLMNKKYYSPFRILLFEGLIGVMVSILIFTIAYFIPCQEGWKFCKQNFPVETFTKLISDVFQSKNVGYCMGLLVLNGGLNLSNILANHLLSPTHKSVGDTVSSFILSTNMLLDNQNDPLVRFNWVLIILGDVIILFSCFVFNEIIVLYCCNLHKNTKEEIIRRSEEESNLLAMREGDLSLVMNTSTVEALQN